jgi:uncharacterized protein (DUF433 family)
MRFGKIAPQGSGDNWDGDESLMMTKRPRQRHLSSVSPRPIALPRHTAKAGGSGAAHLPVTEMSAADSGRRTAIGVGSYSLRDAAMLLRIPYPKLRRWAVEYRHSTAERKRIPQAVVSGDSDEIEDRILSFYELMELFVIEFFRHEGVSMPVIRAARSRAQAFLETDYPFATERLMTDGRGIFADLAVNELSADRLEVELSRGQTAFSAIVQPFFRENVDYQKGVASTYWPMGREAPVLLDAARSFGRPIVARNGTPTFALYEMHHAGEDRDRIAAWYDVTRDELDAAIRYEERLREAA